jgi:hypothetical protein
VQIVQQFLRIFLDIVLWRRGPQDLPTSSLLVWLTLAAYTAVSAVQLLLLNESGIVWFFFLVADPLLLSAWVWLVLKVFNHAERFQQTVAAVLGTGAVLGLVIYLPLQLLVTGLGFGASSPIAQGVALGLVVIFALVTGRIIKLATDSSMFTGIAVALTYFIVINTLVGMVRGPGS